MERDATPVTKRSAVETMNTVGVRMDHHGQTKFRSFSTILSRSWAIRRSARVAWQGGAVGGEGKPQRVFKPPLPGAARLRGRSATSAGGNSDCPGEGADQDQSVARKGRSSQLRPLPIRGRGRSSSVPSKTEGCDQGAGAAGARDRRPFPAKGLPRAAKQTAGKRANRRVPWLASRDAGKIMKNLTIRKTAPHTRLQKHGHDTHKHGAYGGRQSRGRLQQSFAWKRMLRRTPGP